MVIKLAAIAYVPPRIEVVPAELVFPYSPGYVKVPKTRVLQIRRNDQIPLEITNTEVTAPGFDVKLREINRGELFEVVISYQQPDEAVPGNGELRIHLKDDQTPTLSIPIKIRNVS